MKKGFQPGKLVHENERPPTEPPTTVFVCNRGKPETVKVQLELPVETFETIKKMHVPGRDTPKQIMEKALVQWARENK